MAALVQLRLAAGMRRMRPVHSPACPQADGECGCGRIAMDWMPWPPGNRSKRNVSSSCPWRNSANGWSGARWAVWSMHCLRGARIHRDTDRLNSAHQSRGLKPHIIKSMINQRPEDAIQASTAAQHLIMHPEKPHIGKAPTIFVAARTRIVGRSVAFSGSDVACKRLGSRDCGAWRLQAVTPVRKNPLTRRRVRATGGWLLRPSRDWRRGRRGRGGGCGRRGRRA